MNLNTEHEKPERTRIALACVADNYERELAAQRRASDEFCERVLAQRFGPTKQFVERLVSETC